MCISAHTHTHTRTHTLRHMHTHTHMHTCTHPHTRTCTRARARAHTHTPCMAHWPGGTRRITWTHGMSQVIVIHTGTRRVRPGPGPGQSMTRLHALPASHALQRTGVHRLGDCLPLPMARTHTYGRHAHAAHTPRYTDICPARTPHHSRARFAECERSACRHTATSNCGPGARARARRCPGAMRGRDVVP